MNKLLVKRGERLCYQAKLPTKSGKFYFSIVAGENAYSSPREFMEKPNYTELEVAIFNSDGEWAKKKDVEAVFPILGYGQYLVNPEGNCVFPYIDVNLIPKALEVL